MFYKYSCINEIIKFFENNKKIIIINKNNFARNLISIFQQYQAVDRDIYLMSQAHQNNRNQVMRENSKQQRCYGCPCGKTYLSYPALFTHVKQKHNGKAPGQLIKPKNDKVRGRPRISEINDGSGGQQSTFNPQEQIQRVLMDVKIDQQYKYDCVIQGKKSNSEMIYEFISIFSCSQQQRNILNCFACYLQDYISSKYGQQAWLNGNPNHLIDHSNEVVKKFGQFRDKYPLNRKILINLVYILFKWMFKNKWTEHRLIRKTSDILL